MDINMVWNTLIFRYELLQTQTVVWKTKIMNNKTQMKQNTLYGRTTWWITDIYIYIWFALLSPALCYILELLFINYNFNVATETFELNFAINCLWIRNVAIFFYNCESFAPNLPWSESDLHLYTRWLKMCYSGSVLMFFLALKTFCLMLRLEHSMRTCLGFLVAAWPTLCDTAISCGWSGGSTFMAAQRVSTAASVSSFSSSQGCL